MARDIEDPTDFQMECLPTGSISFGRFEVESLAWERRSSFSHNRYLEEAEKYSTPGSVTKKKAYFEAHFKRKALLLQASSGCQNEVECKNSENDMLDDMNYMEEFEEHGLGRDEAYYARFDDTPNCSDEDNCIQDSDVHVCEEMECQDEGKRAIGNSHLEFQIDSTLSNGSLMEDKISQAQHRKILQTQAGHEFPLSVKEDSEVETLQRMANGAEIIDKLVEKTDASKKSIEPVKVHTRNSKKLKKPSLKVKATAEQKTTKSKLRTQMPVSQIPPKVSNDKASRGVTTVMAVTKTPRRLERESPLRKKAGPSVDMKPSTSLVTSKSIERKLHPTAHDIERRNSTSEGNKEKPKMGSFHKDMKLEGSEHMKPKSSQENRRCNRDKDPKEKKTADNYQPAPVKGEIEVIQSATRSKRITKSVRSDLRANTAVFNFKSDERAEKRKEFYERLEEKLHAKEAEMTQIQAKTQEEVEAEIKQLRRSLNFKATPMPSFYHEAVPRGSEVKKATVTRSKPGKKSTSPARRSVDSLTVISKTPNQQGEANGESAKTTQLKPLESNGCSGESETATCPAENLHKMRSGTPENKFRPGEQGNRGRNVQVSRKVEAVKKERERSKSN